jgi:hypothetical protein
VTLSIKLNLHDPAELEAFGVFCNSVAAARRANPPKPSIYDRLYGLGGLAGWKTSGVDPAGEGDETASETTSDTADAVAQTFTASEATAAATAAPTRKRGEPSPGKARRTKAEIAEDDAAEKAGQYKGVTDQNSAEYETAIAMGLPTPGQRGAISETPEDRQDPNNPDVTDDAETAEADAADEAAETAAASTGKLTLDDVRNTLSLYVKAYGLAAAQEDGPLIISSVCGEGKVKVSDVADDQIADVIAAIKAAGKANTYKRELLVTA